MGKRSLALLLVCLGALLLPRAAPADTGDVVEPQHEPPTPADGFQAGTCSSDEPVKCSPATPGLFFTQAAAHPPIGFTQYIIRHETLAPGVVEPLVEDPEDEFPVEDRVLKTEHVDLPPGLTVNAEAAPRCSLEDFEAIGEIPESGGKLGHIPNCPESTIIGREEVTLVTNVEGFEPSPGVPLPKGFVISPDPKKGTLVDAYNLEPKPGEPALVGFVIAFSKVIFLETQVAWENDFHESFTIKLPPPSEPFSTLRSRLISFGQAGDGTYITTPTTCFDPGAWPHLYSTWFRGESWGEPNPTFPAGSTPWEAKLPPGVTPTGCGRVPFEIGIDVDPGTKAIDSPAAPTVTTTLPFEPGREGGEVEEAGPGEFEGISQSHLRSAEVALPQGMGLNPSGAQNLAACTDAQFKKGVRVYQNECPAASKIGTVEIETPPLPDGTLKGDIYAGEQKSMDPASGEEFRILAEAKSEERGVDVRLVGNVKADPKTGQLTAVLDDRESGELAGLLPSGLPQAPFEAVKLHFDGSKAVLTSPPTCSPSTTEGRMEPWARPGEKKVVKDTFTLSTDPNGGSCPQTLAERKFAPSYKANVNKTKAGAYSPFHVKIARRDGEQELKLVDVTLPKGLIGKLRGIPYCSEKSIAAAAANSGRGEKANPSCSSKSQIGKVETVSGTGGNPLHLGGKAYLAGPYKGAALSLVTVTPAVAGPFDLGTVVVRVALDVEPETAQIHAVSDVIPDVFGGVKLDLRAINLNVNRKKFMLNPTNCKAQATVGAISGGGADPTNPAAFSSYAVSDPFRASGCRKLGFKPELKVKLFGPTTRAKNPRLKAVLTARKGDANIARTALTMPHSLFLDQRHIGTVCTRPQLASHTCPKASVYGHAEAKSPLLDRKLKGKVFLVSSNHKLPDLLADLRGQVEIYLRGVIGSKHGGLKTVFNKTPDVPVSKVVLEMKGGRKSLLVNSTDTCAKPQRAVLNIKAQNGRKVKNNRFRLNIAGCKAQRGKHRR